MSLGACLGFVMWMSIFIYAPGWLSVALVAIGLVASFNEVSDEK